MSTETKIDLDVLRRAKAALQTNDANDEWPKNRKGWPKLLAYEWEADRLIASGMAKEDDLIRIPTELPKA